VRYLITGGSGYIGSRLVERLSPRSETDLILIGDLRPPRAFRPKAEYRSLDVTDAAAVRRLIASERPDAVIHLAFMLNPIRDEARMYDVDVGGTQNVLDAASAGAVPHVLVTSSAVAYGAFPDNPVPLTEEHPVRGVGAFSYARDKTESDRLCQLWALQHPDRVMTIVRPSIVFGPSVDNYLLRLWTQQPFQADFGLPDPGIQFAHEDDVVEAITLLLERRQPGAFNVAGDGAMTIRECAEMIGMRRLRVPRRAYTRFVAAMWRLGVAEAPPGALQYSMYPWIVSTEKLKRETGWRPRYTTRDTFIETMRTHGKLGGFSGGESAMEGR
jgi:UDP-glucose 4-epimerase